MNKIEIKDIKKVNDYLRKEFLVACTNEEFNKLCYSLKCDENILMKYTSSLKDTVNELSNCKNCKNLCECTNKYKGRVYYPSVYKNNIEFNYKECKYSKNNKIKNKTKFFETPIVLRNASLSDLINEKERNNILKYIKEFLKNKTSNKICKGMYLSGSFGSGKSYILSALLNELSNKGYKTINVYYPTLIQKLKGSIDDGSYQEVIDEICSCDILLIDDIGAENNTQWTRDEVLSPILQYRMDNNLSTFITSNYTINELEEHLSCTSKGNDIVKARRIIERIKYLCSEEKLISKNKRND